MTFDFPLITADSVPVELRLEKPPVKATPPYRPKRMGEYRPSPQMVANARFQPKTTSIRPGKKDA